MNFYQAQNSESYQKHFYEQIQLKEAVSVNSIHQWSNPEIGSIINFGSAEDIQCGLGEYSIPQDFMIRFDYSVVYLHFGIVYRGIAYSVVENKLHAAAVPTPFLSKERTNGGIHYWKTGQHFKGVELSIEYSYLVNVILPLMGLDKTALDFLDYNVRYIQLPDEMLDVIHRVEKNLTKGFMTKPLLLAFCIEFLSYLLNEENQFFFNYQKQNYSTYVDIGNRRIRLSAQDVRNIINVRNQIKENAACFTSIYELSRQHNISEQKLKAGFRKLYNQTIWDYGNFLRMQQAIELLQNSNLSVSEIASRIGYRSQAAFLQIFKKYYDITPGQFRIQFCQNRQTEH